MPEQSALSGIRVVDMATLLAAPGAARYLADFGADVIKIEPPGGEPTRRLGWRALDGDDGYLWKMTNRNKRAVVLDLKTDDGLARMRRLLDTADVLIENMRPGTLERIGLAPAALHGTNPRLVILRVTGFGQTGSLSSKPGFATLAEAMSGFAAMNAGSDGKPLLPPIALTDEIASLAGAFAVMVALRARDRDGAGQVIDVSLLESMFQMFNGMPSAAAHLDYDQPPLDGGIPYTVPRNTYRCADGQWIAISTSAETVAARVLDLLGVAGDPRFDTYADREAHRAELDTLVSTWVGERSSAEVITAFEDVHAAIAPVLTVRELIDHEHMVEREAMLEVDGVRMPGLVAKLSRTPGVVWTAGRTLGADTDAVIEELGG